MPTDAISAVDFLEKGPPADFSICVVFGDERFLKQEVLAEVRRAVLEVESGEGDFALSRYVGDDAELRDVLDALSTRALFGGGRRLVIVDEADGFVKKYRPALEDYVARPATGGVLVLDVTTWPKNTRLYKSLAAGGHLQVHCEVPSAARLAKWLRSRAQKRHECKLEPAAAEMLVETAESDVGLLDQELARLSLLVSPDEPITAELVRTSVGNWRSRTAWDMIDAAAEGNAAEALRQLDRLLLAGENPIGLFAQIAATLRRFATAVSLIEEAEASGRRIPLGRALEQAGVKRFVLAKSERQLKQIGRQRAGQLHHWMLTADLALKGASSSPPRARLVLETLLVRLSSAARPETPVPSRR
ncbi:MAG: DNA polymerase III subunit delta [Pirellulales bacterium]